MKFPVRGILFIVSIVVAALSTLGVAQSSKQGVLYPSDTIENLMSSSHGFQLPLLATAGQTTSSSGDHKKSSIHEKFATFLAGQDFKSVLLLENLRPDLPITFIPSLILSSAGEVTLDPVTVPAHSTATVDINATLLDRGYSDTKGTVAVRFAFTSYGPGAVAVQMRDEKHHIYLNSYGQSSEEYWSGTEYDAVVWTPHAGTQGFITITNTSKEPHAVHTTFLVDGRSEQQHEMLIPPRQTRTVSIDELLAHSRRSGAGIHIDYVQAAGEKYTGAILVEGQLFNEKTGFAKYIHFIDKDLPPTGTLRSHFLMLGRQPVEDNFPGNAFFRSMAAVRNIDDTSVTVAPTVKFIQNGSLQTINLPSRSLAPAESWLIDFAQEQEEGHLPPNFTQGSLELTPDSGQVSIVGELFNFSQTGGYVVGPSLSSYPSRATSSIWRTDGSFQTTIMVENTAPEDDNVALRLYSDEKAYIKTFKVPAGKLLKINVRDLEQNGVPDDKGNLLLDTSGVLSIIGSHGIHSKLAYDKIIHDTNQADYIGLPPNACDFVTGIGLFLDTTSGIGPIPVMKEYDWTQSGPEIVSAFGSSSSNPSLAQISNSGSGDMLTFTPPNDGQSHTVTINPDSFSENVTFCDACSGGAVPVRPVTMTVPSCPTSITISNRTNIPLENIFPNAKTGVGLVASMQVGPASSGPFNGVSIVESVSTSGVLQQTCPGPVFPNQCSGSDTFIVGQGGSAFGVPFPSTTNIFYDFHTSTDTVSRLDAAHINSCTAGCNQTYSCGGRIIGSFTIIRDYTKDTIQNTPVSRVKVTKQ